jgi:ABC-type glucose/galactose transport system permease subunit
MGISPAPSPVEFGGPAVAPTSTGGVDLRGSLGLIFGVLTGLILF